MWLNLILVAAFTLAIYFLFFRRGKSYWKVYGVPEKYHSSLKDNIAVFTGKKSSCDFDEDVYKRVINENLKFCGISELGTKIFLACDIEVAKKVMIKDFDYFIDRRSFGESKAQPIFSKTIVNLHGDDWKAVRTSVSPTFTTGKIRRMMECFNKVGLEWVKEIQRKCEGGSVNLNVDKESSSFMVDVIAETVFGMNAGTIQDPDSTFGKMARRVFDLNFWTLIKVLMSISFPSLINLFGIKVIDDEALTFFEVILRRSLKERESGKVPKRNDFMQLVVEARQGKLKGKGVDELSAFEKEAELKVDNPGSKTNHGMNDDEIAVAQMIGFFIAGFSTTANTIGLILYTLALNPKVQEKLREEIKTTLFNEGEEERQGNEDLDYDEVNRLSYLDMVVSEVLRLYPALARLERVCVKDYVDPDNGYRLPKGTVVAIPVQAIHRDPRFYDRPHEFYPEHFSPEQKAKRSPYAYLSFGSGPRGCVGMRFALVTTKATVAHILRKFRVEPSEKTPVPLTPKLAGIAYQMPANLELKFIDLNI